ERFGGVPVLVTPPLRPRRTSRFPCSTAASTRAGSAASRRPEPPRPQSAHAGARGATPPLEPREGSAPTLFLADDLEAVEVREPQVEDDDVGWRVRLPPAGPGSRVRATIASAMEPPVSTLP